MRVFHVLLVLLVSSGALAQGGSDEIAIAQRFVNAGALETALTRVERLQPADPAGPRWNEWETLRCSLLYRLNRRQDLVRRVASLPATAAPGAARHCLLLGARAAVATSQGPAARDFLARLLWRRDLPADEMRQARLLVIESYLVQNLPRDAYALMLRYQHDAEPVGRDTAARFVEALLAADMPREAVNWMAQLDDTGPLKLRLRLRTGLISADGAIAEARAVLAKTPHAAAYWTVLREAALQSGNRALQAEALEHVLQLDDGSLPVRRAATAAELWKAYLAAAHETANQNQLLVGDDGVWADYASRRMNGSPVVARAFYAHLVQQGRAQSARLDAQLQLVFSLQAARLGLAAVRLFEDSERFPAQQLDAQARYLLGSMALEHDQPAIAARYWLGLDTPPALDTDEWRIRLAQVLLRAGAAKAGAGTLRALLAGRKTLPEDAARRVIALLRGLLDDGHHQIADELYRALLPLAPPGEQRDILGGLGRAAEAGGDYRRAADYYLQCALLTAAPAADATAINARFAAAANLVRAGLKEDARNQFKWLLDNVRDAEKLELVRREMAKL